jgi:hypothetical protein
MSASARSAPLNSLNASTSAGAIVCGGPHPGRTRSSPTARHAGRKNLPCLVIPLARRAVRCPGTWDTANRPGNDADADRCRKQTLPSHNARLSAVRGYRQVYERRSLPQQSLKGNRIRFEVHPHRGLVRSRDDVPLPRSASRWRALTSSGMSGSPSFQSAAKCSYNRRARAVSPSRS